MEKQFDSSMADAYGGNGRGRKGKPGKFEIGNWTNMKWGMEKR